MKGATPLRRFAASRLRGVCVPITPSFSNESRALHAFTHQTGARLIRLVYVNVTPTTHGRSVKRRYAMGMVMWVCQVYVIVSGTGLATFAGLECDVFEIITRTK